MISVTNNKNTRISHEKYQAPGSAVVARWAGNPEARVRFPAGAKYFSVPLSAVLLSSLPDETRVVETGSLIKSLNVKMIPYFQFALEIPFIQFGLQYPIFYLL